MKNEFKILETKSRFIDQLDALFFANEVDMDKDETFGVMHEKQKGDVKLLVMNYTRWSIHKGRSQVVLEIKNLHDAALAIKFFDSIS